MKILLRSSDAWSFRWRQRAIEGWRRALNSLRRSLTVERPAEALALIPIRTGQPPRARRRPPRGWRD